MTDSRLRFRVSVLLLMLLGLIWLTASINIQAQTGTDPTPVSPQLLITPKSGEPGTIHIIYAYNLIPDTDYRLDIVNRDTDAAVVSEAMTSNDKGGIIYNFVSQADTPPGVYFVTVYQGERVMLAGSLTVTGAEENQSSPTAFVPSLVPSLPPTWTPLPPAGVEPLFVEPTEGPIGTNHAVTARGLQAAYTYRLDVIFDDSVVYSTSITTTDAGDLVYSIFSESGDTPGVYTLMLYDGDTLVRQGALTILGEAGAATSTPQSAQPSPSATITETSTGIAATAIAPASTATPSAGNSSDTIQPGQPVAGDLTEEKANDTYTFTGVTGSVVTVRMESPSFDAYLLLLDPSGEIV
ncbi:MAG TPA: hypothetical protein VHL11_25780, partial [Phototrophicaceae bacterium]|nr:hypothetical protein [Phototrophicaceae bacterium]